MKALEDRKRALLAESEVYRQTLRLEIYNLQLFLKQSKVNVKSPNPWLLLGALGPFLAGRPVFSRWRFMGAIIAGWRLYNQFSPLITKLRSTLGRKRRNRTEAEVPSVRF
jgi:hypothetical protein